MKKMLGLGKSKKDKEKDKQKAAEKQQVKEELPEDSPPSDDGDMNFAPVRGNARGKTESMSLQPGDPIVAQMSAAEKKDAKKDMAFKVRDKRAENPLSQSTMAAVKPNRATVMPGLIADFDDIDFDFSTKNNRASVRTGPKGQDLSKSAATFGGTKIQPPNPSKSVIQPRNPPPEFKQEIAEEPEVVSDQDEEFEMFSRRSTRREREGAIHISENVLSQSQHLPSLVSDDLPSRYTTEVPKATEEFKIETVPQPKPQKVNLAKSVVPGQRPGLVEPQPEVKEEERPRVQSVVQGDLMLNLEVDHFANLMEDNEVPMEKSVRQSEAILPSKSNNLLEQQEAPKPFIPVNLPEPKSSSRQTTALINLSAKEMTKEIGGEAKIYTFKKREPLPSKYNVNKTVSIPSLLRMLENEEGELPEEDQSKQAQSEEPETLEQKMEKLEALARSSIVDTETRTSSMSSLEEKKQMDLLKIIELNEKANIPVDNRPQKVYLERQESMQDADEEYKSIRREILTIEHMGELNRVLNDRNLQFYGVVSAAACFSNYLFVGNDMGFIRVFDLGSPRPVDMKPLHDPKLHGKRVTCIDVAPGMRWLTAGYENGAVALWDMQNYKLEKLITDVHESQVTGCRVYHTAESKKEVLIVSAEASGKVKTIELKDQGFLRGTQAKIVALYEKRLQTTLSVCVHRMAENTESAWAEKHLTAFGAMSEVCIVQMGPPIVEVMRIKRPTIVKPCAIPYLDYGQGLTPGMQDYTCPLLAIAWDNVIQLVYFDEIGNEVQMDGFYVSDNEINAVFFVGNSLLMVLIGQSKIKLLNTKKFYHGDYRSLQLPNDEDFRAMQLQVKELTKHAEISLDDPVVTNCRMQALNINGEMLLNYNNTVIKYKRSTFFFCQQAVTKCLVPTHEDFIEKMQQSGVNWITVLKIALEIYTGEMKGFSNVREFKDQREAEMLPAMQRLLMSTLMDHQSTYRVSSIDTLPITIAIEFCIRIQSLQFLFTEVFQYFDQVRMRAQFVRSLEPFILSGQLKTFILPPRIIGLVIHEYEASEDYQVLEKLIQQLDLSQFPDLPDLEAVCQSKFMVSALIYLYMGRDSQQTSCMNILNTMYKTLLQAKMLQKQTYSREDLQKLLKAPADKKYQLERSYLYIGYKFLWIIQMFLKGKRFPNGELNPAQYRQHVLDIVNFISTEEYLSVLLEFDPSMFFRVISRLFEGKPWQFLRQFKEHECIMEPNHILPLFETKGQKKFYTEQDRSVLDAFHVFLLQVSVAQDQERKKSAAAVEETISIEYKLIYEGIKSVLTSSKVIQKQSTSSLRDDQIDESLIIDSIRAAKLQYDDIDVCLRIISSSNRQNQLINVVMELYECQLNYKEAFKCLLQSDSQQVRVFRWIPETLEDLAQNAQLLEEFKVNVKQNMLQIAQMEIGLTEVKKDVRRKTKQKEEAERNLCCLQTLELIKTHFGGLDSVFYKKFVVQDLPTNEHAEYHFLRTVIVTENKEISETIRDSTYMKEKQKQGEFYKTMLVTFTKRVCQFEPELVEYWVEKDYFPTEECLVVVRESKNLLAEAKILEKMNKRTEAIALYLEAITSLSPLKLSEQLLQIRRDECDFGQMSQDLAVFDNTIEKAVSIAEKKTDSFGRSLKTQQNDDEEVFYSILDFLNQYMHASTQKLDRVNKKMNYKLKNKDLRNERMRDFVVKRIRFILERDTMPLSLRQVADRLGLEIEVIQKLSMFKMDTLKENKQRLDNTLYLQEDDLLYAYKFDVSQDTRGFMLQVAQNPQQQNREVCPKCSKTLLNASLILPCRVFLCGHTYHSSCVLKSTSCLVCEKSNVLREEAPNKKQASKAAADKKDQPADEDDDNTIQAMIKVQTPAQKQRAFARAMTDFDRNLERESLKKGDFFLCEAPKFRIGNIFKK